MLKKLLLTVMIVMTLALAGCHSKRAVVSDKSSSEIATTPSTITPSQIVPSTDKQIEELIAEAREWIGTPYVYGGHSRKGTDCSGLIMELFLSVYNIKLPRSSAMQYEYADPVEYKELTPGDLVFFTTSKNANRVNHVGLYIGNDRMIHASSSRGVMESALSEKYWQRTLHSQGRIVSTTDKSSKSKKNKKQKQSEVPSISVEQLQELYDAIDQQIDSIYVSNPEIFD